MQLNSPIEENFRLKDAQKKALKRLGLVSVRDLLFHFPSRYESFGERKNIINAIVGEKTTVYGKVIDIKRERAFRKKLYYTKATISDNTGFLDAIWFSQPYIAEILHKGDTVALTGKITSNKGNFSISSPEYHKVNSYESLGEGASILAVYPETTGVSSRWFRMAIDRVLKSINLDKLEDPIPEDILKKYSLPSLKVSLILIHAPQKIKETEAARKRFSFEEIFFIQLARLKNRAHLDEQPTFNIKLSKEELDKFLGIFPFELTGAQRKAIDNIIEDMSSPSPMSRLLEGDVGSGKTAVAVAAAYATTKSGYQVAYMAPTEILAQQHFESFIEYFSQLRLTTKIGLITSSGCRKYPSKVSPTEPTKISRAQLLKWVGNGEIPILIGTHSLINKKVEFEDLGLVIIDEQHRFGTKQRASLVRKCKCDDGKPASIPHLLSMTATPIPRTLALTIYGDLDLSLLDEMPAGRKKVETVLVPAAQRERAYEQIRHELKNGRQIYVICPRIDEPDPDKEKALQVKAAKTEAKRLKEKVFQEFEIEVMHGKMSPAEKEDVLNDFRENKTQILVSTSVIEVGINIPNSTVIIIEGAERFGLAQLHQLRGRVMRGSHQPYCFVFTSNENNGVPQRLKALKEAKNGFELAEHDLKLRGPGALAGAKQWGISDIGMEALKNIKMVEAARVESQNLLKKDPLLKKQPVILKKLKEKGGEIHFE